MERLKNLGRFEKFIALVLIVMVAVFLVLYIVTTSRVGFSYRDVILVAGSENGNAVYAGEIDGEQACFTVSADRVVTFSYGGKTYGPYTVKNDPSAMPEGKGCTQGVEIRVGDEVLFRGGYFETNDIRFLYHADGTVLPDTAAITTGNSIAVDSEGNVVDKVAPSVSTLITLAEGPELTHKGMWGMWFLGFFLSAVVLVSIPFADELFRFHLSFHAENVDEANPTDWEIFRRHLAWGASSILILVIFIIGLG